MKMTTPAIREDKRVKRMVKDPVCGMEVDEKSAPAKSECLGKSYYFCSPGCKKAFDWNPAWYASGGPRQLAGYGGRRL